MKECRKVPFEIKKRENKFFDDDKDAVEDREFDNKVIHKRDENGNPVKVNDISIYPQFNKYEVIDGVFDNLKRRLKYKRLMNDLRGDK